MPEILKPLALAACLCAASTGARAADLHIQGYADLRLQEPAGERSWLEGGDGRYRFGRGDSLAYGELVVDAQAQFTSTLSAHVVLRAEPDQRRAVDIIEGYVRWRPLSLSRLRWSVKAGAFFPPISLENDEIGWTSPWTLTPSALNSWVGEELRAIGSEVRLEWRRPADSVELYGALYGWNDPAGILLADRGWALHDRPTGLLDRLRLPDAFAAFRGVAPPLKTLTFKEIDDRPGWYGGIDWTRRGVGGLHVMRYDNRGDPAAFREQFAWDTRFWALGGDFHAGPFSILAQNLRGETVIVPSPTFRSATRLRAFYLLLGLDLGEWRLAVRGDRYYTRETASPYAPDPWERGTASTFAVSWLPTPWFRMTAEVLRGTSIRDLPLAHGEGQNNRETQLQLAARIYY